MFVRRFVRVLMGIIVVISKDDRLLLLLALTTEQARVKRAISAESSQAIREIHDQKLQALVALQGRVFNEVAK